MSGKIGAVLRIAFGCVSVPMLAIGVIGWANLTTSYKYAVPCTVFGVILLRAAITGRRPFFM